MCAAIALAASRTRGSALVATTGPFWLRIGILCAVFALLRAFEANVAVSRAIRGFSHSTGLTDWKRPGPYLMIAALIAVGAAVAGLILAAQGAVVSMPVQEPAPALVEDASASVVETVKSTD